MQDVIRLLKHFLALRKLGKALSHADILRSLSGENECDHRYIAHLSKIAPQVYPAPKLERTRLSPFLSFPASCHSLKHIGIVAAVVLPYLSMLTITLSADIPIRSRVASIIRRFA